MQEFQKIIGDGSPRTSRATVLYLILLVLASGCERDTPAPAATSTECIDGGALTARVYGAIEATLDWRGGELECDGMPRPFGEGARLRFAGPATAQGEPLDLAFIIALPELRQGEAARELAAGVTLIEESTARFFRTPEPSTCWADIDHQRPLESENAQDDPEYRIRGLLYCVSPLAEVNGNRSVTLTDVEFAGRLNWREPE